MLPSWQVGHDRLRDRARHQVLSRATNARAGRILAQIARVSREKESGTKGQVCVAGALLSAGAERVSRRTRFG